MFRPPAGYKKHYDERIKHRFSLKRMKEVVDSLTDVQNGYLKKHGFGEVLNISSFFVPIPFLEWVMDHLIVGVAEFIHKRKSIRFTKSMVQKVLGIPSGDLPVQLSCDDDQLAAKLSCLRDRYLVGDKAPISHAIYLLQLDEVEESFMRTFMLIFLATVLCPSTQNSLNLNYLNSLHDVSAIAKYDWSSHILSYLLSEVKRYHSKVDTDAFIGGKSYYFGSCLPFLAVVYMDFLDLHHSDDSMHKLCYADPRICNITQEDINFILEVDRNKSSFGQHDYGVISFRDISCTPYAISSPASCSKEPCGKENSGQQSDSNASSSSYSVSFDFILMQHSLDHKMYKKSFIENAGFSLQKIGLVHIPCYSNNQWVLVVVNFLHNTFDVLDSEKAPKDTKLVALSVISNFKQFFVNAFPTFPTFNINEFPTRFIQVPKNNFRYDSGVFVLNFVQTYDGTTVANFSNADVVSTGYKQV